MTHGYYIHIFEKKWSTKKCKFSQSRLDFLISIERSSVHIAYIYISHNRREASRWSDQKPKSRTDKEAATKSEDPFNPPISFVLTSLAFLYMHLLSAITKPVISPYMVHP